MWRGVLALCVLAACNTLLGVHTFERQDARGAGDADDGALACTDAVACSEAHAVTCDAAPGSCQCAAGFAATDGACAWVGVVVDPEVSDSSKWTLMGAATIEAVAGLDPGRARLPCDGGSISQTVTMPRYADAGPLVASITFDSGTTGVEAGYGIGDVWHERRWPQSVPNLHTVRSCLGAGEYAPPTSTGRGDLRLLTSESIKTVCSPIVLVDHLEILPANPGECPVPATVLNGDLEATSGWVTSGNAGLDVAAITPSIGEGSTQGLRLYTENACSVVSARTLVSVPATASPALRFYRRSNRNGSASVPSFLSATLAGQPMQVLDGTTATERYCVPPALRGGVFELQLVVNDVSAACGTQVRAEALIDNVAVYDDPACGTNPLIADASFESGYAAADAMEGRNIGTKIDFVTDVDAREGTHLLRFSRTNSCTQTAVYANVIVPESNGSAGPAVTLQYKVAANSPYPLIVSSGTYDAGTNLMDDAWHAAVVCLDPARAQRSEQVRIRYELTSGGCGSIAATFAKVDDLVVTTHASCPTQ